MAMAFTDNNGTTFHNINDCRSFRVALSGSLQALENYVCSEVVLVNKTDAEVLIYDNGYSSANNSFALAAGESFILRGITNSIAVSAVGAGSGYLYYRTQYYSSLPQR